VPALLLVAQPGRRACEFSTLAYFAQNNCGSTGEVLTYEGALALANYLKERLAVKPLGYRDCAVEMNAGTGRLAHVLARVGKGKIETSGNDFTVVATDVDFSAAAQDSAFAVERMGLEEVVLTYRPAMLVSAWRYASGSEDWIGKCKECVPDPDFKLDVPEFVLIGPSRDLLDPALCDDARAGNKDGENRARQVPRDGAWRRFEGYERVHLDHISRHLLHVADDGADKYGHVCCVSFRSTSRLAQFRSLHEVARSKAQGKLAKAQAEMQRGGPQPSDRKLHELLEAQAVLNGR